MRRSQKGNYGFRRDRFARSSASATTTAIANAASAKPSTIQNSHHIQNPNSACVSVGRSIAPVRCNSPTRSLGHGGKKDQAFNPVAKATKGKTGTAGINGPVRRSSAWMGLRVGEASADLPTTSEIMDATARRDGIHFTNSVSTGGPARDVETVAGPIFADPSDPATAISVSARSLCAEKAAAVRVVGAPRQIIAAVTISQFTGGPNLGEATAVTVVSSRRAAVAPILRRAA